MLKESVSTGAQESELPHLRRTTTDEKFRTALSILDGLPGFGGALWNTVLREASAAQSLINTAPEADKHSVFDECLHKFQESMVTEIERWAPRYVELATAFPQSAKLPPIDFARERLQKIIDRRLRSPDLEGAIAFWLVTMSGGDVLRKDEWNPPIWMVGNTHNSFPWSAEQLIRQEHQLIKLRLESALDVILPRLNLDLLVGGNAASGVRGRVRRKSERSRVIKRRDKVIFLAASKGLKGPKYCSFLDDNGIHPLRRWIDENCPNNYKEAYRRQKWRGLIHKEKSRVSSRMKDLERASPQKFE